MGWWVAQLQQKQLADYLVRGVDRFA